MIRKQGNKYILYSKTGNRRLGTFRTRAAATRRERQVKRVTSKAKYGKR
tara:strand:+ start:1877 stop:2023 length:147 start_codon:yes stop_codon:yes gene_type:complete